MSDRLGHLTFGRHTEDHIFLGRDIAQGRNYSEEVAAYIDEEVRKIVEEGYQRAYSILKENWDKVVVAAEALKEKETLTREVFERLMQGEDLATIEAEQAAAKAAAEASQTPAKPVETEQRAVTPSEREGIAKKTPPQPAMELE